MLIHPEKSALLMIDLQERLAPAIQDIDKVVEHNLWLARLARRLSVPVVATEHYPAGVGRTLPALRAHIEQVVEKIHFSAQADGCLRNVPALARAQVVITGTEAHVCVLQTALDLRAAGKDVFVVAEATGSRRAEDRQLALERMRQEGCRIVSREMVAFEWLQRAGTDIFREVHRAFIR